MLLATPRTELAPRLRTLKAYLDVRGAGVLGHGAEGGSEERGGQQQEDGSGSSVDEEAELTSYFALPFVQAPDSHP